jgi:cell division transport system permease protein
MRAFRYAFDEAMASLWRGRKSAALSAATIALALLVLGAFLIVIANLERLGRQWSESAEMSVYLKDTIAPAERAAVEAALTPSVVQTFEYVSPAAALGRFKRTFGELANAVDTLGENPLPASLEVRLRPGREAGVEALADTLRGLPGVADVRYDRQWLARLVGGVRVLRGLGLLLGTILTAAAALTVANVVRLALHARRDELDIMELVGAPQAYIRGPFVMEGTLQGGVGAVAALGVLGVGYLLLRGRYLAPLAAMINLSSVTFLSVEMCLLMVLGGMLVGCVGGLVAGFTQS